MTTADAQTAAGGQPGLRAPEHYWYLLVIAGAASLVIGVILVAYPGPSVDVLGVLIGIDLLIVGVTLLGRGLSNGRDDDASPAATTLLLGTLALIGGVIVVRNPGHSLVLVVLTIAIYLIVTGALALAQALIGREGRWSALTKGIIFIAAGTVIVSWPEITTATLAVLAGISLCLQGIVEIAEGFVLRRA
jgi:uncharacterized membrane protein HdeD (DUF308 family)